MYRFDALLITSMAMVAWQGHRPKLFSLFCTYLLAFLLSGGNSISNAGSAGASLKPREQYEKPAISETRPADSLAASNPSRLQRPQENQGEAGSEKE